MRRQAAVTSAMLINYLSLVAFDGLAYLEVIGAFFSVSVNLHSVAARIINALLQKFRTEHV